MGSTEIDRAEEAIVQKTSNGSEPSGGDAELVDGILVALRSDLVDVARVLGAELEERRRARAPRNVVDLDVRRRR